MPKLMTGGAMPVPPEAMRRKFGPFQDGDFYLESGRRYVEDLIGGYRLKRSDAILDIGCGCGNTALWLTRYLEPAARFEGFEIAAEYVDWCREHISRKQTNYRFQLADIRNLAYNPGGALSASDFRFPYDDASFDVVLARSVFTHLLPDAAQNYLAESARVLKNGGRCIFSFFLADEGAQRAIENGTSTIAFVRRDERYYAMNPKQEEAAIAYDERHILTVAARHGLQLSRPVVRGLWPHEANNFHEYQDHVELTKG